MGGLSQACDPSPLLNRAQIPLLQLVTPFFFKPSFLYKNRILKFIPLRHSSVQSLGIFMKDSHFWGIEGSIYAMTQMIKCSLHFIKHFRKDDYLFPRSLFTASPSKELGQLRVYQVLAVKCISPLSGII